MTPWPTRRRLGRTLHPGGAGCGAEAPLRVTGMAYRDGWSGLFATAFEQSRNAMILTDSGAVSWRQSRVRVAARPWAGGRSPAGRSPASWPAGGWPRTRNGPARWPRAGSRRRRHGARGWASRRGPVGGQHGDESGARCHHHGRVPVRVLIVDDQPPFREIAREVLHRRGYTVVGEAGCSATALAAALRLQPDAVLLDMRLGDESGFEVAWTLGRACPQADPARLQPGLRPLPRSPALLRCARLRAEVAAGERRARGVLAGPRLARPRGA